MKKQIVLITRTGETLCGAPYEVDINDPKMFDYENSPTYQDFNELDILTAAHNLNWVNVERWYVKEVD